MSGEHVTRYPREVFRNVSETSVYRRPICRLFPIKEKKLWVGLLVPLFIACALVSYCKSRVELCSSKNTLEFLSSSSSSSSSSSGAAGGGTTPPSHSCPSYFRWIHEDLRPWKSTGITEAVVEQARTSAHFRLLIVNGSLYVETYSKSFQTRDIFTWWGFLQLLRKSHGRIPDLELMFNCNDIPVVSARDFPMDGKMKPPPLFSYCKDGATLEILFPDWSFWGWSEINIRPWMPLTRDLKEGNRRRSWMDREPYAFWKGNPTVSPTRQDLLKCNLSQEHDWNARLFIQDWVAEATQGFQHSNLEDQCTYRYKIYVEGNSWSVSKKYILACNSMMLLVASEFEEFFGRGLEPLKHYWPINKQTKCNSIKFAVDWGNSNKQMAEAIGRNGSKFIMEEVKMEYVYDYMFHLLSEYAKLMRYKPRVPPNAKEITVEFMLSSAVGTSRSFMNESMAVDVSHEYSTPCSLPPSFSAMEMEQVSRGREEALWLVQSWEQNNTFGSNSSVKQ